MEEGNLGNVVVVWGSTADVVVMLEVVVVVENDGDDEDGNEGNDDIDDEIDDDDDNDGCDWITGSPTGIFITNKTRPAFASLLDSESVDDKVSEPRAALVRTLFRPSTT